MKRALKKLQFIAERFHPKRNEAERHAAVIALFHSSYCECGRRLSNGRKRCLACGGD